MLTEFLEDEGLTVERGIGGHGLLVTIGDDPRWLLRADMDALPSDNGARHACGHDGHMAMLAGALPGIAEAGASIAALFQPSEEDGSGMARCLEDPRVADLAVKGAFGIHNLPGRPLGTLCVGPGALASTGIRLRFMGREAHAAHPDQGANPYAAMRATADAVGSLAKATDDPHALATLIHVRLGEEAYGTSPGRGLVSATLRGSRGDVERMHGDLVAAARQAVADTPIRLDVDEVDPFPETVNTQAGRATAMAAARAAGLDAQGDHAPFAWSEDFGHAVQKWGGALVGLGSGPDQPPLHDDDYTFPEELLEPGVRFWTALAKEEP